MARRAKQFGLRVLYYIAPQTWASRSWRNAQLREWVDQVACILPFEEEWFRSHGVAATYVGHPLAEAVAAQMGGMAVRDKQTGRMPVPPGETGRMPAPRKEMGGIPLPPVSIPPAPERERPLVAILPGSRRQVVAANLPVKLRVARMMAERRPELRFAILCASEERRREIEEISSELRVATNEWGNNGESRMASCEIGGAGILPASDQNGNREGAISASSTKGSAGSTAITAAMRVQVVPSLQRDALLRSADLALITSGTASLEAAFYSLPMVVTYEIGARLGRVVGFIRPQLIQTPHLCIVNVLAGRRIVPEFMPHVGDASCVARTALQLLQDHLWRRRMTTDLTDVVSSLGERQASAAVCRLIAEKF
jgi:lipid-A-disaccharide synthase